MTHDYTWMRYATTHVMITIICRNSWFFVYIYEDKSQQRGINNYTALSIKDLFIAFVITFVNSC